MATHVVCMGTMRNPYNILGRKCKGMRPLGRPRNRWENIKMDFKEIRYEGVAWIQLALDKAQWWVKGKNFSVAFSCHHSLLKLLYIYNYFSTI
jgi:hypothetical protein